MWNLCIKDSANCRIVLLFIGAILVNRIVSVKSAPSNIKIRRNSAPQVETLQVSKVSQVDEDDGEVWYPTIDTDEEYSLAKDHKVPEHESVHNFHKKDESINFESKDSGESHSNEDSEYNMTPEEDTDEGDWIQAIAILFKKFGFRNDQIPEPFGSQKSQTVNMPSPEFGLILQGLISKTPTSLNQQLKEIIQAGGIEDLDSKSQDKMTMLKKIDKTVTEIQEGLHGSRKSKDSKTHKDSDSDTYYSSKTSDSGSDLSYDDDAVRDNAVKENSMTEESVNLKQEAQNKDIEVNIEVFHDEHKTHKDEDEIREVGDDTENENYVSKESVKLKHEEIAENEVTEVNAEEFHDEHKKHKDEMLEVIRKLSETSQEDKERIKRIEDIVEKIDQQHYRELEIESRLQNLERTHDDHGESTAKIDSQPQIKETEDISLQRVELEKNPTEKFTIQNEEIRGNGKKKNQHKTKSHGIDHRNDESESGENVENAAEFTEKFHHVKKTRKGKKHKEKSMQDSKETQFADIREDSLKPYSENTSTEKTKSNAFASQSSDHHQNSQNNNYSHQDDYDNRISMEEKFQEIITEKPLPLASVSFKHTITNVKPGKSSKRFNSQNNNRQQSYSLQLSNTDETAGSQRTSSNAYRNQGQHHHVQEHGDAVIDIDIQEGNQRYD